MVLYAISVLACLVVVAPGLIAMILGDVRRVSNYLSCTQYVYDAPTHNLMFAAACGIIAMIVIGIRDGKAFWNVSRLLAAVAGVLFLSAALLVIEAEIIQLSTCEALIANHDAATRLAGTVQVLLGGFVAYGTFRAARASLKRQ